MDTQALILTMLGATFAAVAGLAGVVAGLYRRELACQERLAAVRVELEMHRQISEGMHRENVTRLTRIERALHINDGGTATGR